MTNSSRKTLTGAFILGMTLAFGAATGCASDYDGNLVPEGDDEFGLETMDTEVGSVQQQLNYDGTMNWDNGLGGSGIVLTARCPWQSLLTWGVRGPSNYIKVASRFVSTVMDAGFSTCMKSCNRCQLELVLGQLKAPKDRAYVRKMWDLECGENYY